ncbi:MAG: D-alanyl-D-alanine carboxypeptidase/D-alanyl-D-alanine-endopeptidase [Nocardioidaceae bacterium]
MSDRDGVGRPRSQAGRAAVVLMLCVVLLLGALGYGAYRYGWVDGLVGQDDEPLNPVEVAPPAALTLPKAPPAPLVLHADSSAPTPDRSAVQALLRRVTGDPDLGRHLGVAVSDLTNDRQVASLQVGKPELFTPASTLKLLTTATALQVLGPGYQFTTSTELARHEVVLVGGGDPLLARRSLSPKVALEAGYDPASLTELATRTAVALRQRHIERVKIGVDATLFTGPPVNPHWEGDYVSTAVVSPIVALLADRGYTSAASGTRAAGPALSAGDAFSQALRRRGITVTGSARLDRAPPSADPLAQVNSPPLDQVVEYVISASYNEGAEVLLRQAALGAGRPGSFAGGVATVRATMRRLGVTLGGAVIYDGSGLSRHDRLPLATLLDVLRVAASPDRPALRAVITGLPVAGFTGTMAARLLETYGAPGRGLVRAKTGTLTGVTALAGLIQDRDGTLLAFAALADRVHPIETLGARAALDRIVAALATCGC